MKIVLILTAVGASALLAQSSVPLQSDLSGARLQQVSLAKAHFASSDLSNTTFRSINLTGATLTSCNLSGAEISASNLSGMKIDGVLVTDLQKAYQDAKRK
jgi:uncharacterized protein YjbI with pentapeptide repeats